MPTPALYDLTPVPSLLLVGLVIALVPVAWVWWSHRHDSFQSKTQTLRALTLFLAFQLVLLGAFTRLTDSGLGCPDWPGCYANASPIGASDLIEAAQTAMPNGPVTHAKAWIVMLHRYLATGLGVLIVLLTFWSWKQWLVQRSANPEQAGAIPWPRLSTLILALFGLQVALGALTVTQQLFPAIVTLHLLGALGLLILLCVQLTIDSTSFTWRPLQLGTRRLLVGAFALLIVQVALGGWVSSNHAALACRDFPTCQGKWWPEMDLRQGFAIWHSLGITAQGKPISLAALTAVAYVHRAMAWVLLAALFVLALRLNRLWLWRSPSRVLGALAGLQLITGLGSVVLSWPLLSALLHTGGAAALLLLLTWMIVICPNPSTHILPEQSILSKARV